MTDATIGPAIITSGYGAVLFRDPAGHYRAYTSSVYYADEVGTYWM